MWPGGILRPAIPQLLPWGLCHRGLSLAEVSRSGFQPLGRYQWVPPSFQGEEGATLAFPWFFCLMEQ